MPEYDDEIYWEIVNRQKGILSKEEQLMLKNSQITIIGCGGIGGAAIEMLARMGVGKLRIVDKDIFDLSNINRQLMSNLKNVGRPKTEVAEYEIHSINPFLEVEAFNEELNNKNVSKIISGSDLVLDALDNLLSRILVSRCAKKLDIPFIHGAIHGTMGQITVFSKSAPTYEELFKLPSSENKLTDKMVAKINKLDQEVPPVIGPIPNIIGCLQAFEAFKLITRKGRVILAPRVLICDLIREEPFSIVRF
jgi:molybdopterin/thiamine biosynthesis adenylyltransferase